MSSLSFSFLPICLSSRLWAPAPYSTPFGNKRGRVSNRREARATSDSEAGKSAPHLASPIETDVYWHALGSQAHL